MSWDTACETKTSTHLTPSQSTSLTGALQATSSVKACWAGQRSRVIHHPLRYSPESFRVSPPPPLQLRGNGVHTPCQPDQKQPVPGQHLFPADFLLAMPLSWGNLSWAPFPWRSDHHISESSLWAQHTSTWYFARKTHREDCRLQYNTHSVIPSV